MSASTSPSRTRRVGGLSLWFAVLGGFVAWAAHLAAAWSTDELVCASGHGGISGTPLTTVLTLMVVIPAAIAAAALVVACRAWANIRRERRGSAGSDVEGRSLERAGLMALVGIWADLLFFTVIAFGGVALWVLPPCRR